MAIELDRALFRRLVWLDIVIGVVTIVVIVLQLLIGRYAEFGAVVEALAEERFGPAFYDRNLGLSVAAGSAILIWMTASVLGLLWFKRWARFGYWAAVLLGSILVVLAEGYRPAFTSTLEQVLSSVHSAVFGSIVLLSHAKGYGVDWFGPSVPENKV